MTRLFHAVPGAKTLLERVAERGQNLAAATKQLEGMLDDYGARESKTAVEQVNERGLSALSAVAQLLERERRKQRMKPSVKVTIEKGALRTGATLPGMAAQGQQDHDSQEHPSSSRPQRTHRTKTFMDDIMNSCQRDFLNYKLPFPSPSSLPCGFPAPAWWRSLTDHVLSVHGGTNHIQKNSPVFVFSFLGADYAVY